MELAIIQDHSCPIFLLLIFRSLFWVPEGKSGRISAPLFSKNAVVDLTHYRFGAFPPMACSRFLFPSPCSAALWMSGRLDTAFSPFFLSLDMRLSTFSQPGRGTRCSRRNARSFDFSCFDYAVPFLLVGLRQSAFPCPFALFLCPFREDSDRDIVLC